MVHTKPTEAMATRAKKAKERASKRVKAQQSNGAEAEQVIPWEEIFTRHVSVVQGHLRMLEMIQKHTLIDSDNWGLINSMVERSREMLMQSEDASTSRVGPSDEHSNSPTATDSGDATNVADRAKSTDQGGATARQDNRYFVIDTEPTPVTVPTSTISSSKRPLAEPTLPQRRKSPTLKKGRAKKASPEHVPVSTSITVSHKRPLDEHALPERQRSPTSKKVKAKESSPVHLPEPVEFEDISAEVDARMKEREEKRKRNKEGKKEGKRKRDSEGNVAEPVQQATVGEAEGGRQSKRVKAHQAAEVEEGKATDAKADKEKDSEVKEKAGSAKEDDSPEPLKAKTKKSKKQKVDGPEEEEQKKKEKKSEGKKASKKQSTEKTQMPKPTKPKQKRHAAEIDTEQPTVASEAQTGPDVTLAADPEAEEGGAKKRRKEKKAAA